MGRARGAGRRRADDRRGGGAPHAPAAGAVRGGGVRGVRGVARAARGTGRGAGADTQAAETALDTTALQKETANEVLLGILDYSDAVDRLLANFDRIEQAVAGLTELNAEASAATTHGQEGAPEAGRAARGDCPAAVLQAVMLTDRSRVSPSHRLWSVCRVVPSTRRQWKQWGWRVPQDRSHTFSAHTWRFQSYGHDADTPVSLVLRQFFLGLHRVHLHVPLSGESGPQQTF